MLQLLKKNFSTKSVAMISKVLIELRFRDTNTHILHCLGLQPLDSIEFEPESCSQRKCYFSNYLPHSIWKSEKVSQNETS